jgi:Mg2+-importing ATPase
VQSRASPARLFRTAAIVASGVFIAMGPVSHYFKMQYLPGSSFALLAAILLGYMALTQGVKGL